MKTDSQLQQDVCAELKWEPSINATQIGVQVKDGIVTLAGDVDSYSEKVDAELAAQRVGGVKGLATAINVKLHGKNHRRDADIAQAAEHVLSWSNYVQPDVIKVAVEKGRVTLSGKVRWDFERRGAIAVIRHLKGVVSVIDQITIKDKVSSKLVKDDIEAALKRRARQEGSDINVEVAGTNVTLTGTVHSWSERDLVNYAAKNSPGVWTVIDNLTVVS
nr:BON domain-containing protein [Herbaspirillum sp. ASV7]